MCLNHQRLFLTSGSRVKEKMSYYLSEQGLTSQMMMILLTKHKHDIPK